MSDYLCSLKNRKRNNHRRFHEFSAQFEFFLKLFVHALKISNRGKKVSSICNGEKNVIVEFQLFNISKNVFTSEGLSFDVLTQVKYTIYLTWVLTQTDETAASN